jgi:hypothetical protein
MNFEDKSVRAIYALGGLDARKICIDMVMQGTKNPVQTATLKALQRDRRRIAMLIAGDSKDLRRLVDSYTMASEENKA